MDMRRLDLWHGVVLLHIFVLCIRHAHPGTEISDVGHQSQRRLQDDRFPVIGHGITGHRLVWIGTDHHLHPSVGGFHTDALFLTGILGKRPSYCGQ